MIMLQSQKYCGQKEKLLIISSFSFCSIIFMLSATGASNCICILNRGVKELHKLFLYFPVECLSCVQCTSLQSQECIAGNIEPTSCAQPNSTYCIKYEGDVPNINSKFLYSVSNTGENCQTLTLSPYMLYQIRGRNARH